MNSRRAAEGRYHQAGIVGKHNLVSEPAVVQRFSRAFSANVGADSSNGGSSRKFGISSISSPKPRGEFTIFAQLTGFDDASRIQAHRIARGVTAIAHGHGNSCATVPAALR